MIKSIKGFASKTANKIEKIITVTTFTNQFDFRNNVYSAFFTYSNNLELIDLDYQIGLRAEQTDRLRNTPLLPFHVPASTILISSGVRP